MASVYENQYVRRQPAHRRVPRVGGCKWQEIFVSTDGENYELPVPPCGGMTGRCDGESHSGDDSGFDE